MARPPLHNDIVIGYCQTDDHPFRDGGTRCDEIAVQLRPCGKRDRSTRLTWQMR